MTRQFIPYVHPLHQGPLVHNQDGLFDPLTGVLYPIIRGIPRFCQNDNYTKSFGFQWNQFQRTQLDVCSDTNQSRERFVSETGWDFNELSQCNVLEVGSGAGRFTDVFLRNTTGVLYSVDYSSAVEANRRNNISCDKRLQLAQASIYELPFPDNIFDKVFCLGVLQHTPSFRDSVKSLVRKVRVGGEIVIDFYPINGWYTKIHSKYLLRPFTKRLPQSFLLELIRLNIRWMLVLFDLLCFLRLSPLTRFIPIADVRCFPRNLTPFQRREWALMDTFDAFSPEYDNPQRVQDVVQMFNSLNCCVTFAGLVDYGAGSSMVVRAIKKEC